MKKILLLLAVLSLTLTTLAQTKAGKDVIKVLAIGNSFSEDAVEQHLWDLAHAVGREMIVGNMYIGGCTLERHARNCLEDRAEYEYRKIGLDGRKRNARGKSLSEVLADEQWDYVSLQQASGFSGIYDSFHPHIDQLIAYVRARVHKRCKIIFHQTWAYQANSNHADFPRYGKDQMRMYQSVMQAERQVMKDLHIKTVVPNGTAVQNARQSSLGDNLTRDGFHLNLLYGRYLAACTWYEVITGKRVKHNPYAPQGMTPEQILITRRAAHRAVRHPWKSSF